MTEKVKHLYHLTIRLPFFLTVNNIFLLFLAVMYPSHNYLFITLFLGSMFLLLFICGEFLNKKIIRVIILSAIGVVFIFITQYIFSLKEFLVPVSAMVILFTYSSIAFNQGEIEWVNSNAQGLFHIVALLAIPFTPYWETASIIIVSFVILVLCRYLGIHIRNMDRFFHSHRCRINSKSFRYNINKNGLTLSLSYIVVLLALSMPMLSQDMSHKDFFDDEQQIQFDDLMERVVDVVTTAARLSGRLKGEETTEKDDSIEIILDTHKLERNVDYRQYILRIILVAIIICILVIIVIKGKKKNRIKILSDNQYETLEVTDCAQTKGKKRKRIALIGYGKAIRNIFKRKVMAYRKIGISLKKSSTAKTILSDISSYETVDELNKTYHKARYSNEPITKEELDSIKTNLL